MAKIVMSRAQVIAANDFLKTAIEKDEASGLVSYKDGWSDAIVAERLGDVKLTTGVQNLRLELYGKLVRRDSLDARVTQLEAAVRALQTAHHDLSLRYDKLCDQLSVNRITDVRHLRTTERKPLATIARS